MGDRQNTHGARDGKRHARGRHLLRHLPRRDQRRPAVACDPLEDRRLFSTITVTSVADTIALDGKVTLREAMTAAGTNAPAGDAPAGSPGLDAIHFNIPGPGVKTIAPLSALPAIDLGEPVVIDGYTQPGSSPNTLAAGNDAHLLIELNGAMAGANTNGLDIYAGGSTVTGLVINRFGGDGIYTLIEGGNTFTGNFIGTDPTGTLDRGNKKAGIHVVHDDARVGGTSPADRNLISGNDGRGVSANAPFAWGVVVQGNYVGTDRHGTADLGNGEYGIGVGGGFHVIGGTAPGAGNLVSGNGGSGVHVGEAPNNVVQGNRVGTDVTGTLALGNDGHGVVLEYVTDSLVGGTDPAARNVIAGNAGDGVLLAAWASGNTVAGNYIGTTITGADPLGNKMDGVHVVSHCSNNVIGGTAPGAGNVIAANGDDGVELSYTEGVGQNKVQGNLIGTRVGGLTALGNADDGVVVTHANDNTVGGTDPGAGNVIAGNGGDGIELFDNELEVWTWGNTVAGNTVGLNRTRVAALGNAAHGVRVDITGQWFPNFAVPGNTIRANLISANGLDGVHVTGATAGNTVIAGNRVGTAAGGAATNAAGLGNKRHGVAIVGAPFNTVGGPAATDRNLISNNAGRGVSVVGAGSFNNVIAGNHVGTDLAGTAALGNGAGGVVVEDAHHNLVGRRNVISGNKLHGVRVTGTGAHDNRVLGNLVGTTAAGTAAVPNAGPGVIVEGRENQVGGIAAEDRNVIAGNLSHGVLLSTPVATGNRVEGNTVGLAADGTTPMGNKGHGVLAANGASRNAVGGTAAGAGNRVGHNAGAGVAVTSANAVGNAVLSNAIFSNALIGIDLAANGPTANDALDADAGPNGLQNAPVVKSAVVAGGTTTVHGTLHAKPNATYRVQLFNSAAADPTGFGEGQSLVASLDVTTDAAGNAAFVQAVQVALPAGSFVSATATSLGSDGTSEFSAVRAVTADPAAAADPVPSAARQTRWAAGPATVSRPAFGADDANSGDRASADDRDADRYGWLFA